LKLIIKLGIETAEAKQGEAKAKKSRQDLAEPLVYEADLIDGAVS
jgi:hypothetical protein